MNYVKLYTDALYAYKRLSDTEFGRALRAVLQYAEDGTEPNLPGKECIMFDVLREQVERDRAAYNTKIENGKKGGRPPKKKENLKNRPVISDSEKTERNQDKDKEEYIPPYNPPNGEDDDEDDLLFIAQQNNRVYVRAKECGFATDSATLDRLTDLISMYGHQAVLDGLDQCVEYGAKSLAYLRKVVEGQVRREVKAAVKTKADYAAEYL
jgi:hypothetical protein